MCASWLLVHTSTERFDVLASGMARPERKGGEPRVDAAGPDTTWVGKCLAGRYLLEQQLGAGGAGTVYRARHLGLDRTVAVKVLQKRHHERWVSRKRFDLEARALAQLSHVNIIAVSDCGVDAEVPFIVMDLLEGESLEFRLRKGPLPVEVACQLALQLLEGLAFVHERELVHRDVKPGNIFLERREQGRDRVKLLDFGLAKLLAPSTDAAITRTGDILGTPAYMAPEQITGEPSDARTDVYAAGLVLFEMIAGRRPFLGNEPELLRQQLCEPLPRLAELKLKTAIHSGLDAVLQKATEKDRAQRYANARALSDALLEVLSKGAPVAAERASVRPKAERAARASNGAERRGFVSHVLRAGAVLVCALALIVIAAATGVIFALDGPEGEPRRLLVKRALGGLWSTAEAPAPPPPTP